MILPVCRCLASFEPDVHRKRLMHRQRVARLQPLHGVLNPEFFLGLVRSIALELGNVSREIIELEEQEGRPPAKVRLAGWRVRQPAACTIWPGLALG